MLHPTSASKKWSAGCGTKSRAARARRRFDDSRLWRLQTYSLRPRIRRTLMRNPIPALRASLVPLRPRLPRSAHHRLAYLVPSSDKDLARHAVPITSDHARQLTRSAKGSPLIPKSSRRGTLSYLPSPRSTRSLPHRPAYSQTLSATHHNWALRKARSQVLKRRVRTLYPQTLSRISTVRQALCRWLRW